MTGRNRNGTFAHGNTIAAGYGRPPRRTESSYLVSLSNIVTEEHWHAIVTKAIEQAVEGDFRARDWLSTYLLGSNPLHTRPSLVEAHASNPVEEIESLISLQNHDRNLNRLIAMTGA
jgi:hypothetical protein